jgi:hypothetical protein
LTLILLLLRRPQLDAHVLLGYMTALYVRVLLQVSATGSASSSQSSSATARVLTSPPRLLAAVAARLIDADQAAQQSQQEVLPSGESVVQALIELQEDIKDYDQHVYSRMSQRDMQGL